MTIQKITAVLLTLFLLTGCSIIVRRDAAINQQERAYRRFPSKSEGAYRIIQLFYATDRKTKEKDGKLYFTSNMADSLTTGSLQARIIPGLKIEKAVPKRLKKRGDVGIEKVEKMADEDFIKNLSAAVENSPHKSLLVFVYGYQDNFEMTAIKASYFAYLFDVNTPILLFDWPGDHLGVLGVYKNAHVIATASGPSLGNLLIKIIKEVKPRNLGLVSSSLGCQVSCKAFEWMYQQKDFVDSGIKISHVVLAAPDVSKNEFNKKFKDEIASLADKLTVYVSSNDKALLIARVVDLEKKLGLQKVKIEQNEQFEEAKDLLYLKSLAPDKITIIDVTPVDRAKAGHTYYIETPEFYDDLYMRLFGAPAFYNRRLYLMKVKENVDYWVMYNAQE
jgi:esterase/lipase superfamily enzyme